MPRVTLTFDNGPEPHVTPHVLDILDLHEVRTTFFLIGENLEKTDHRLLAERAREKGHWIGNHTYTHSKPLAWYEDPRTAVKEIEQTQRLLGDLTHPDRLFRPFGGGHGFGGGRKHSELLTDAVINHLITNDYTLVLWNCIAWDWHGDDDNWVERAVTSCTLQPWVLLVLHDIPSGAMLHLDRFLRELKDMRTEFRQEFPPECVPIRKGKVVGSLESIVSNWNSIKK